jgi:hypothetical protein
MVIPMILAALVNTFVTEFISVGNPTSAISLDTFRRQSAVHQEFLLQYRRQILLSLLM